MADMLADDAMQGTGTNKTLAGKPPACVDSLLSLRRADNPVEGAGSATRDHAADRFAFPISQQGRRPRLVTSQRDTWPALPSVNASPTPSRTHAHDSGPWPVPNRYHAGLFHPLLHAGSSRRSDCPYLFLLQSCQSPRSLGYIPLAGTATTLELIHAKLASCRRYPTRPFEKTPVRRRRASDASGRIFLGSDGATKRRRDKFGGVGWFVAPVCRSTRQEPAHNRCIPTISRSESGSALTPTLHTSNVTPRRAETFAS